MVQKLVDKFLTGIYIPVRNQMAMNTALKIAFIQSGKRQIVAAAELAMDETRLSKIVNGHLEATPDEKKAIAKLLKRPVHQLFSEAIAS